MQKKLTNCFEYMWCDSWCSPTVSVVSICLLWLILWYPRSPPPTVVFWWVPQVLRMSPAKKTCQLAMIDLLETIDPFAHDWVVVNEPVRGNWLRWLARPRHLRWLMGHKHCCRINMAVRQCKVVAQFEVLREPIFGPNFAIFVVLCARCRGFAFWRARSECMVEPSVLRRIAKFLAWKPWHWQSPCFHTTGGWSVRSRFPLMLNAVRARKTRSWHVWWM